MSGAASIARLEPEIQADFSERLYEVADGRITEKDEGDGLLPRRRMRRGECAEPRGAGEDRFEAELGLNRIRQPLFGREQNHEPSAVRRGQREEFVGRRQGFRRDPRKRRP